jgi:thioredoxin
MIFGEVKQLSKKDFLEKVYNYEKNPTEWKFQSSRPCVIDFYATWCGPCKAMAPLLDEISKTYAGKIDVYKIDVDVERELSAVFGIRSIPTLLFCPIGAQPQMAQGAMPKDALVKAIEEILLKK